MLVPISRALWLRWGIWSIVIPVVLAAATDFVFFTTDQQWSGWFNYLFVWSSVHRPEQCYAASFRMHSLPFADQARRRFMTPLELLCGNGRPAKCTAAGCHREE